MLIYAIPSQVSNVELGEMSHSRRSRSSSSPPNLQHDQWSVYANQVGLTTGTVDRAANDAATPRAYSRQTESSSTPSAGDLGVLVATSNDIMPVLSHRGEMGLALAPIEDLESSQPYTRSTIDELHLRTFDSRLFDSAVRRRSR